MTRYVLFGFSLGFALFSSLGPAPVLAQTTEDNPYPSSEQDPFSSGLGEDFDPLDLLHRSNLSRGRSLEEYRLEQEQDLNDAASQFRQQQQQLLQQESQNAAEETDSPKERL